MALTRVSALFALAVVVCSAPAVAQNLVILSPRSGLEEYAGRNTRVRLNLPPGLDGFSLMDGEPLEAQFSLLNENGFRQFGPFTAPIISGDFFYDDETGATFTVDLGIVGGSEVDAAFASTLVSVVSFGVRTLNGFDFNTTRFDSSSEAADQTATLDVTRPVLVDAVYSSALDRLRLEFSEPLSTFDANNDFNETNPASLTRQDLQVDLSNDFTGGEFTPDGVIGARFVSGTEGRVIEFDVVPGEDDIQVGRWIRPAWDSFGNPLNDFRDVVGNAAAPNAVQIRSAAGTGGSGDVDGDGLVNAQDLALLLGRWGNAAAGEPADINDDGFVDAADLAQLLGQWGGGA